MEKVSKNLFRMFRNKAVTSHDFLIKFKALKKTLSDKEEVQLDSEYHQQLKAYIDRMYLQTCVAEEFTDKMFEDIREAEMSNLNRLQKLKNVSTYKKDKHKSKHKSEDWG